MFSFVEKGIAGIEKLDDVLMIGAFICRELSAASKIGEFLFQNFRS